MWKIRSFYIFKKLTETELADLEAALVSWAKELQILGLVIVSTEGLNTTICGSDLGLSKFIELVREFFKQDTSVINASESTTRPFRRFRVRRRSEIVTLGREGFMPNLKDDSHLEPEVWHQMLQDPNTIVIDTRNWYETKIGKFRTAIDPKISVFTEFSDYVEKAQIPKDKNVLIYCTGGIRCEKGIAEFQTRGYDKVYQLKGGILNYLKKFPDGEFDGECFVFDHRTAVDTHLQASKRYHMCAHCGQPADEAIECRRCDSKAYVCDTCLTQNDANRSCSKNCHHHLTLDPNSRGERQKQGVRFEHEVDVSRLLAESEAVSNYSVDPST